MMEHLSTLFYRLLMHSSICILEEFNFFFLIHFIVNSYYIICYTVDNFFFFLTVKQIDLILNDAMV